MAELSFTNEIAKIASVDLFKRDGETASCRPGSSSAAPSTSTTTGRTSWSPTAGSSRRRAFPKARFLLAYYENEADVSEAVLLRVLRPTRLPTDSDVISSMVEYYKDNLRTSGSGDPARQLHPLRVRLLRPRVPHPGHLLQGGGRAHALRRRRRELLQRPQLQRREAQRRGAGAHRQLPRGRGDRASPRTSRSAGCATARAAGSRRRRTTCPCTSARRTSWASAPPSSG